MIKSLCLVGIFLIVQILHGLSITHTLKNCCCSVHVLLQSEKSKQNIMVLMKTQVKLIIRGSLGFNALEHAITNLLQSHTHYLSGCLISLFFMLCILNPITVFNPITIFFISGLGCRLCWNHQGEQAVWAVLPWAANYSWRRVWGVYGGYERASARHHPHYRLQKVLHMHSVFIFSPSLWTSCVLECYLLIP